MPYFSLRKREGEVKQQKNVKESSFNSKYFSDGSITHFLEMEEKTSSSTLNSGNHHSKLNEPNKSCVYD